MPKRAVPSPIKFPGGKSYLVPTLIELTPKHRTRVEVCGGGCQYTLGMDPLDKRFWLDPDGGDGGGVAEVVNDIDTQLTTFWDVLRDEKLFKKFKRMAEATQFSVPTWKRAHAFLYGEAYDEDLSYQGNPVFQAWAYFVNCRQSMMGAGDSFAPVTTGRLRRGMNEQVSAWLTAVEGLDLVHARLRTVLVENSPAVRIVKKYDKPGVFMYVDPPYPKHVRAEGDMYKHEMTDDDHRALLGALADDLKHAKVAISSYPSPMYDLALAGWNRVLVDLPNNMSKTDVKDRKQEAVYMNY